MSSDAAPDDAAASDLASWTVEVTAGPNKGAIVRMEPGSLRIGSGTENDIVLADGKIAEEQVLLGLSEGVAEMETLSAGMTVDGAEMSVGRTVEMQDGMVLQAGSTTLAVHGPHRKSSRRLWLVAAAPLILLAAGGGALVGFHPQVPAPTPPRQQQPMTPAPALAEGARQAFQTRLIEAGLSEHVTLQATTGAVVAEGALAAEQMPKWSEQQMWFDGHYHGSLSLVNRVAQAAVDDVPNIPLRAVSAGAVPYLITQNGDRFVEGAVVDGWTIEAIAQDKVVFSKNGHRVEEGL